MHIAHFYESFHPSLGGPPVVVTCLASAQRALGHEVTLVSNDRCQGEAVTSLLREHAAPPPRVLNLPSRSLLLPCRELLQLSSLLRTVDIVHLHGLWNQMALLTSWGCRALRIPYVLTPHGMLNPWCLERKRWRKRVGWLGGFGSMVRGASAIQALNPNERAALIRIGLLEDRILTIPNGVSPRVLQSPLRAGSFRAKHPGLGTDPYVLFLSRLHPGKGLDILVRAFCLLIGRHPKTRLVIAGPDAGALSDLRATVATLGVRSSIHLVGPLYGEEKFSAFCDASVFCLPSRHEGFSMAILEAMACGLPCVISEACSFPELERSDCGVVTSLEPESVAAGLEQLLSEPERAKTMGARARQLVVNEYTWPRIAERALRLYESTLKPR